MFTGLLLLNNKKYYTHIFRSFMADYFALGDTNKDSYIDCEEFRAISATFDIPVTKADVSEKM